MEEAEFDRFAEEYYADLRAAVARSGESPEFFASYKIADVAKEAGRGCLAPDRILDFGSGIGSSIPHFRRHFPHAQLLSADVSRRSLDIAHDRFPGQSVPVKIDGDRIPLEDGTVDVVFSACVFHHIPPEEQHHWLDELYRIASPGGMLLIYEHNPWNPLTVKTVNACPFDENAVLLAAPRLKHQVAGSGWSHPRAQYRLFFPRALSLLRPLERLIGFVPVGAQYYVCARKGV